MGEVPHDMGFGRKISPVRGDPHRASAGKTRLYPDMNQCSEA